VVKEIESSLSLQREKVISYRTSDQRWSVL